MNKIRIRPSDVIITCVPSCDCDKEHRATTTDLSNVMSVGMPICPDCGEEMDFSFVELYERKGKNQTAKFTLRSTHGTITASANTGAVLSTDLSEEWPVGLPIKIDVNEWRDHYFGETLEGEHDVLDFGYWYVDKKTSKLSYNNPSEDWREDRERRIAEEADEREEDEAYTDAVKDD